MASSRRSGGPTSSPDLVARSRPRDRRKRPACGFVFRGSICDKRGSHYCEPRADKVVAFFAELLVHTKGRFARTAFVLDPWQEHDIVRPLFGEVVWSDEWAGYVRRFRVAQIVLGRKNGKSELAAGIVLYLLVGDDEESAEVYGAAKDTKQAGKVADVVKRMRDLQPLLNADARPPGRLSYNKNSRRLYDERTASYYEVITADALGELGHNPHGFVLDEVLSQPDGSLWDSMRTAGGTRAQPLLLLITTETNDPSSFGAGMIDEAERVEEDPARAPHVFVYIRKLPRSAEELERLHDLYPGHPDLPVSTDVFDERNWRWPNPALGSFLTVQSMREEAVEARNEPQKENPFRQYRCNQRVSQVTRWMPMHRWDAAAGRVVERELRGRACFSGLDLASTTDLACEALLFPPEETDEPFRVLWRFWTPEAQLPVLDSYTNGAATQWVRDGYLVATEGDWIDYWGDPDTGKSHHGVDGASARLAIHPQIEADAKAFRMVVAGYDPKEATATAQHLQQQGITVNPIYQGFMLSPGLKEIMRLVKAELLEHGGHPVARWCFDSAEVRTDDEERIKLVKPARDKARKRVDAVAALATAVKAYQLHIAQPVVPAAYAPPAMAAGETFWRPGRLHL